MSFPLQPCTVFTAKGSQVPECLEGWPKKHPTCEECICGSLTADKKGKKKKLPEQKALQTTQSGSDTKEQNLSETLSSLLNERSKTFHYI